MRCAFLAACVGVGFGVLAVAACNKKTQDGLPPATDWQSGGADQASVDDLPAPPAGLARPAKNPHAGLDTSGGDGDPHAGLDMSGAGGDPHAGLDMSGGGGDPHAGLDVTKMGLSAPDPDRALDPSHRVAGMLGVDAKLKSRVSAGTAVFLIVKRAGGDGAPSGPPLAVDKLTWAADGVAFELTEEQAMVAGTALSGEVVITARYDQDGDAMTKEAGDVTGQVRVTVPAEHVKLTLDTLLP
jgi:hypothetical protein